MNPMTTTAEIDAYVAEVATFLADLPAEDRDDLLDDLSEHLREVARETDQALVGVVGTPEAYATELRSSAGYDLPDSEKLGAIQRACALLVDTRAAARERIQHWPGGKATVEFVPTLRPAWWVLRGYLVGVALAEILSGGWRSLFPIPMIGDRRSVGLVVVVATIVLSVALGRRFAVRRQGRGVRVVVLIVNVAVALYGLSVLARADDQYSYDSYSYSSPLDELTNLYPYDLQGKPLDGVQLLDQHGNPVWLNNSDEGVAAMDACSTLTLGYTSAGELAGGVFPTRLVVDRQCTGKWQDFQTRPVPSVAPVVPETAPPAAPLS